MFRSRRGGGGVNRSRVFFVFGLCVFIEFFYLILQQVYEVGVIFFIKVEEIEASRG